MAFITKDPDEVLDYTYDWSERLGSDIISTSTWVVPSGLTKNSDTFGSQSATVWLSAGVAGATYAVLNRITTAAGRTLDHVMNILVMHKGVNTIGGADVSSDFRGAVGDEDADELTDDQINRFMARAVRLYSMEKPFIRESTLTTVADQDVYALPPDAIRLLELQYRKPSDYQQVSHADDYLPQIATAGLSGLDYVRRQLRLETDRSGVGHYEVVTNLTSYGPGLYVVLYPAPTTSGDSITYRYSSQHPLVGNDYFTIPAEDAEIIVQIMVSYAKEWRANKMAWGVVDYYEGQTRIRKGDLRENLLKEAAHERTMALLALRQIGVRYG